MLTGALVWVQMSSADLMKYKPVWLLRSDASSLLSNKRVPAVAELTRRFTAGELTDGHIQAIISDAIVFQANPNFPWLEWDGLMNKILLAEKIGQADWVTFVRQAIRLKLQVRPRIRAGDPMPVALFLDTDRLPWSKPPVGRSTIGTLPGPPHFIEFQLVDVEIAGSKAANIPRPWSRYPTRSSAPIDSLTMDEPQTASLTEGVHRLSGHVAVSILTRTSQVKLATINLSVDTNVTILPATTDPKDLFVTDQATTDAMLNANWNIEFGHPTGEPSPEIYVLRLSVGNAPVAIHYRAFLRAADGKELKAGQVVINSRSANTVAITSFRVDIGDASSVDVILRRDFESLKRSVFSDPIWGEEIIFRDVKVGASRPFTATGGPKPSILSAPAK